MAHAGLVLTLAAATLTGLARRLPAQNVITAGSLIAIASLGILAVGQHSGIPFGAFAFAQMSGARVFGVPSVLPIYWVALAILARGVSRLPLRPWRKTIHYGYWMIGLSLLIVLIVSSSAEPLLGRVAKYWTWRMRGGMWTWYGMPWSNWLGTAVSFLGMYVVVTPWLINKQPVKQPVDYHPLVLFFLLEIYLTAANGLAGYWAASWLGIVAVALLIVFAVRGARWRFNLKTAG